MTKRTNKDVPTVLPRVTNAASEKSMLQIRKDAATVAMQVEELTVQSVEDVAQATEVLGYIKKSIVLIKSNQDSVLSKLKELADIEKARWKPSLDLLTSADVKLRNDILAFRKLEQENARKAEAKVLKAVASGKLKSETKAMEKIEAIQQGTMAKSVHSLSGATTSFKSIKKLHIQDATVIPREYLVPDETKIKAALKAGLDVPGCEMIIEETIAIK